MTLVSSLQYFTLSLQAYRGNQPVHSTVMSVLCSSFTEFSITVQCDDPIKPLELASKPKSTTKTELQLLTISLPTVPLCVHCSQSGSQQQAASTASLTDMAPQTLPFSWGCLACLKQRGSKRNFKRVINFKLCPST